MNEKEKSLNKINNIIAIALADGVLKEEELEFINTIAKELNLDYDDYKHLLENPENLEFIIPEDCDEAWQEFKDLVLMMIKDRNIDEKEYNKCLEFAQKMDLSKKDLDYVIQHYNNKK